jgi:hypothetical protein
MTNRALLCLLLALPGCCTSLTCVSAHANEGAVPCEEDEIQITDDTGYSFGGRSWVATCSKGAYLCEVYGTMPNGVALTRCERRR